MKQVIHQSTIRCPKCGQEETVEMADDSCRISFRCAACGETLTPLAGDCCVFCSYGTVPCPPVQMAR
jgi:transposase-like protein